MWFKSILELVVICVIKLRCGNTDEQDSVYDFAWTLNNSLYSQREKRTNIPLLVKRSGRVDCKAICPTGGLYVKLEERRY